MASPSPVMAIIDNESQSDFAHRVANTLGYTQAEIVVGSPVTAIPVLQELPISPQHMLIDIGERGQDILEELDKLAEYCDVGTRVIVIGSINDVNFYRDLRNRGIAEYFTRPAKISEVRAALIKPQFQPGAGGAENNSQSWIFSFMSAASGDGSSTAALSTAYSLASVYNRSTVLIDMDYQFGMIAKNLDLSAPFGIRELFEYPDRGIDSTLLERMLVKYGDNMKVISAPNDLRVLPDINPAVVRDLLITLREQFDCVVVDLPHIWTPWVGAALTHSSHCIMVAQLWLRSVTHSSRLLNIWREIGIDDNSISVLINRSGAKFKEAVSARDYERVCDKSIDFYLSNDIRTVVAAENRGQTIPEVGQSQLEKQFREFAGKLIGETESDGRHLPAAGGKSALSSLFGNK